MIAIIDYGLGNLGSVANMLKRVGAESIITSKPEELEKASHLILPGVGHFDHGMKNLRSRGLEAVLNVRVKEHKVPVLGICLGMQLLARKSEEGTEPGLGWVAADVKRIRFEPGAEQPVPHMGWNDVEVVEPTLFEGLTEPRYYFVHSFQMECDAPGDVAAWTTYGRKITAAVRHGHIFGTQFHPEKSHRFGLAVLKNFTQVPSNA